MDIMRKFFSILLVLSLVSTPAYSWWWSKKAETPDNIMENKGYNGDLPNLNKHVIPPKEDKAIATPVFEANEQFDDPATLKPTPRDNPAFVNIILKSDKSSKYLNHINEMISQIEKLIDSIDNAESDQLFVAKARVFKFKVDHLKRLYDGKSESFFLSYKKLQQVGAQTDTIATLRHEAVTYKRYLAYQTTGSVYNPANIAQQLEYLRTELQDTLMILKEER